MPKRDGGDWQMERYAIVIPSKNRPDQAKRALSLLPDAVVYVDQREADVYREVIPEGRLRLHRPTSSLPEVRNLLLDDFDEPVLIQADDDLVGLRMAHNKSFSRLITNPDVILDVIENGIQCATDLNVGVFGWSRTANPMHYAPFEPISLVAPIFGTYGVRGSGRRRLFDPGMFGRADTDFVLQTLLEDRIVYQDRRFYFDHGPIFSGAGGCVDMIGDDLYQRSTRRVQERWGRYIVLDEPSHGAGRNNLTRTNKQGVQIRVTRRSPLARGD